MEILVVILSGVLALSQAQVFSLGKCPSVTVKQGFDLTKYLGDWYEITKFYASFEGNQRCARATYTLKDNGHIEVFNRGLDSAGKVTSATGDAYIADNSTENAAKLSLRFSTFAPYGKYWILDTDYKEYTLIYSCSDLAVARLELAWILGRQRTMDPAIVQKLKDYAKSMGIDVSHFQDEDQTNCNNS